MYSFLHSDKETETSVAMVVDKLDVTWTELTDRYIDFLRASGFVFSEEKVKQYLADSMLEHTNAEKDYDSGTEAQHEDDISVDVFAQVMKNKMAQSREVGRTGWNDTTAVPTSYLKKQLQHHIHKGDPVDVANYCMMLWVRGESTSMLK